VWIMHACVCMYVCICSFTWICVCMNACKNLCLSLSVCVCVCVSINACLCVGTCVCVYIYIYKQLSMCVGIYAFVIRLYVYARQWICMKSSYVTQGIFLNNAVDYLSTKLILIFYLNSYSQSPFYLLCS
jgi:hypothetical protein